MIGGPLSATITGSAGADKFDLLQLLRAPVEIYGEGSKLVWWGFVDNITAPNGPKQSIGLGLDEMYNYITVAYADGETAANSDTNSINEYGQKEARLTSGDATQAEGEQTRDLYLADHKEAPQEFRYTGGAQEIELGCYGWYSTLGWKYYTNTSSTNIENTTQISAIVTGAGQFFAGSVIENTAGITSNQYRDGHGTALTYINQLLNAGTSNVRPLLATVDKDRYLHVYERSAEPPNNKPRLLWRGDGRLETALGEIISDQECRVAEWMKVKDVPDNLGGFSTLRSVFIEQAEYNAREDRTVYSPANAYQQIRLAKYLAQTISGQSDGSGGGYTPPIFWTPEADPLKLDILTSYYQDTLTDIASGASVYINTPSITGTQINTGNTGLVQGSLGGGAKTGWRSERNNDYIVFAQLRTEPGTSVPTSGLVNLVIYDWRETSDVGGFSGQAIGPYPPATTSPEYPTILASAFSHTSATIDSGFIFRVINNTDGDIRISELRSTFIKIFSRVAST